jgi:hypothetical protein
LTLGALRSCNGHLMHSPVPALRGSVLFVVMVMAAIAVSCAGTSGAGARGAVASADLSRLGLGSEEPGVPSSIPTFQLGVVPGNSASAPLPTDAPAAIRGLPALPSCGAEVLFEQDVDLSPIPTAPGPVTDAETNQQAADCLISAWQNGRPAELVTSSISDEADEIYSIYRLPGNGTVDVIVRVRAHADQTIAWTRRTCRQLSVQQGAVTPADCEAEAPVS